MEREYYRRVEIGGEKTGREKKKKKERKGSGLASLESTFLSKTEPESAFAFFYL